MNELKVMKELRALRMTNINWFFKIPYLHTSITKAKA
jgi:hypothetical protein